MSTTKEKNWYDTMLESQKKMTESITETAKKFTSPEVVTEAMENSKEFFDKWLHVKADKASGNTKNGSTSEKNKSSNDIMENWKSFYENFAKTQSETITNSFKKSNDMFNQWTSSFGTSNPFVSTNPFATANAFMGTNPFMQDSSIFNTWNTQLADMYKSMTENFNNKGKTKEMFEGIYANMQSYMKFYEMMSPVLKAMQDKSFTPDQFSKYFTPDAFKGFMDSFFGFLPENMQGMMKDNMNKWNDTMKSMNNPSMDMFKGMNMGGNWQQFVPQGNQFFAEMMKNYNTIQGQMQNSVAPYAKLFSPNDHSDNVDATARIIDMMNRSQISNAHMQFLTYTTGIKAMEAMNKSIAEKVKEGKSFDSMQEFFKEWLNTSDKYFVELFESDEFSKTQAENSSLSLQLKHAVNGQMEKMFVNLPLVPRSEMEELYKTVYELKKRIRTLEKESGIESAESAPKSASTRTSTAPKAASSRKAAPSRKKGKR